MTKMTRRSVVAGGMAMAAGAAGPAYTQTKQNSVLAVHSLKLTCARKPTNRSPRQLKKISTSSPIGATRCSSRVPSSSHFSVTISISAISRRRTFQSRSRLGRCLPRPISSATPTT